MSTNETTLNWDPFRFCGSTYTDIYEFAVKSASIFEMPASYDATGYLRQDRQLLEVEVETCGFEQFRVRFSHPGDTDNTALRAFLTSIGFDSSKSLSLTADQLVGKKGLCLVTPNPNFGSVEIAKWFANSDAAEAYLKRWSLAEKSATAPLPPEALYP